MKHKLTPTQFLCLIASAIIIVYGCERHTAKVQQPKTDTIDTASFITKHSEIPKK